MVNTEDYRTGRHCVFGTHAHLVFVTKYRRNVLTGQHHDVLRGVFAKVCADFGATLSECNEDDDHVHLLVEYPPQMAVSKPVNSLKGVASRRLKQQYVDNQRRPTQHARPQTHLTNSLRPEDRNLHR
ncbi:putative transposase [Actinopolyspora lacussalsi]|nr:putative transposase [Actinopolyspora lacussalsi]